MAYSMTGLGLGEAGLNGINVKIEIRSVNNRFLEISCRMPSSITGYEQMLREIIRKKLDRGKIYVQILIQGEDVPGAQLKVNPQSVRSIKQLLEEIKNETDLQQEISLDHYLKFSEIFDSADSRNDDSEIWETVQTALSNALDNLIDMRSKEGKSLIDDIEKRLAQLQKDLGSIESDAVSNSEKTFQRLKDRIDKIFSDQEMDEGRIYLEAALMAEKSDITEECVRLRSHCNLFSQTIKNEALVGKKLNFLLQEMNREVNTISSKALSAEISQLSINMKGEIEKIREQVQNLE